MAVRCAHCNAELAEDDVYHYRGKGLCEECYMMALQRPKICDAPAAVLAKKHREKSGRTGTDGLLDIQKKIHDYIQDKGRAARDEIMNDLNISEWELEKHVAILRPCELVKGKKKGESGVPGAFRCLGWFCPAACGSLS